MRRGRGIFSFQVDESERVGGGLRGGLEDVVPVMEGRAEALDGGMQGDHGLGHVVAGGVGVEAAGNAIALGEQRSKPSRVGSSAGGREAKAIGIESGATDSVDGRFAEDGFLGLDGTGGEVAEVLARAWSQAMPSDAAGAAQFGADSPVIGSQQQEDGIGAAVGIELAGLNQNFQPILSLKFS